MAPSNDQALQFVIILQSGVPANQAIGYFTDATDNAEVAHMLAQWMRSKAVRDAQTTLMGKAWQDMTLDEKIHYALNLHYCQLAFTLYSNHYGEVGPADLTKLNTARVALESKLAGTAGKTDALSRFFDDISTGKLKMASVPLAPGLVKQ